MSGRDCSFSRRPGQVAAAIPRSICSRRMRKFRARKSCATATAFSAFCSWKRPGSRGDNRNRSPDEVSVMAARTQPSNISSRSIRNASDVITSGACTSLAFRRRIPSGSGNWGALTIVSAPQLPEPEGILRRQASEVQAPLVITSEAFRIEREEMLDGCVRAAITDTSSGERFLLSPRLPGRFQLQNALNAVAVAQLLRARNFRIRREQIERGIAAATWPGRLEKLQSRPDIYLDGAHNPGAAREVARFLEDHLGGRRVILIFGAMRDKAVDEVTGTLFPQASEVIFTEPNSPRAVSASQLAQIAGHHAKHFVVIREAQAALETAIEKARPTDAIFITGSLYLVGQLRQALR